LSAAGTFGEVGDEGQRGDQMAVAMLLEWPGQSKEQYDELMKRVALETDPPDGGLFHVAGPMPGGWRVVDVWESREAFERFAEERLRPAVKEVGIPGMPEPEFYPIQGVWVAEWELSRSWVND
jgi:hypothetical protein